MPLPIVTPTETAIDLQQAHRARHALAPLVSHPRLAPRAARSSDAPARVVALRDVRRQPMLAVAITLRRAGFERRHLGVQQPRGKLRLQDRIRTGGAAAALPSVTAVSVKPAALSSGSTTPVTRSACCRLHGA